MERSKVGRIDFIEKYGLKFGGVGQDHKKSNQIFDFERIY